MFNLCVCGHCCLLTLVVHLASEIPVVWGICPVQFRRRSEVCTYSLVVNTNNPDIIIRIITTTGNLQSAFGNSKRFTTLKKTNKNKTYNAQVTIMIQISGIQA